MLDLYLFRYLFQKIPFELKHLIQKCFLFFFFFNSFSTYGNNPPSQVELLSSVQQIKKGESFFIGFRIRLKSDWHTYWIHPGDYGKSSQNEWNASDSLHISPLEWPVPKRIAYDKNIYNFGYKKEVLILAKARLHPSYDGNDLLLKSHFRYLICKDLCIPVEKDLEIKWSVGSQMIPHPKYYDYFEKWKSHLPTHEKIESDFERKNAKTILNFYFKKNVKCLELFPKSEVDFKTKPPSLISQQKTSCHFEVESSSSAPNFISGLLIYQKDKDSIQSSFFTSRPSKKMALFYFIFLAFLGGLILNFMPCVIPILFLKFSNTIDLIEKNPKKIIFLNLSYSLGVILSFLILAFFIFISKSGGEAIGWGFHLQSPLFVSILTMIFIFIGFYLLQYIEIPLPRIKNLNFRSQDGISHFMTGILSTTAASPCTVPFMASATAFAFSRTYLEVFLIFFFLGFGLSFPYVFLSFFPKYLKYIPIHTSWMEKLKIIFSIPMFLTAIWLMYILSFQLNIESFYLSISSFIVLILYIIINKKIIDKKNKIFLLLFSFFIIVSLFVFQHKMYFSNTNPLAHYKPYDENLKWKDFSMDQVANDQNHGKNIFISFGAAWCLVCKANEWTFKNKKMIHFFKTHEVSLYTGDWTNKNPKLTEMMEMYGRAGVPFYLFYHKKEALLLPTIINPNLLIRKINEFLKKKTKHNSDS